MGIMFAYRCDGRVETIVGDKRGAHDYGDCVYGTRVDYMMISTIGHSTSHTFTVVSLYVSICPAWVF